MKKVYLKPVTHIVLDLHICVCAWPSKLNLFDPQFSWFLGSPNGTLLKIIISRAFFVVLSITTIWIIWSFSCVTDVLGLKMNYLQVLDNNIHLYRLCSIGGLTLMNDINTNISKLKNDVNPVGNCNVILLFQTQKV